jgi:hypothetical protein
MLKEWPENCFGVKSEAMKMEANRETKWKTFLTKTIHKRPEMLRFDIQQDQTSFHAEVVGRGADRSSMWHDVEKMEETNTKVGWNERKRIEKQGKRNSSRRKLKEQSIVWRQMIQIPQ